MEVNLSSIREPDMTEQVTISATQKKAESGNLRQVSQTPDLRTGKSVRIFLVDDNADFLLGATRFLSLTPHFQVVGTATSGRFALDQIPQLNPDLVIMDMVMPGMNGIEAARILKSQSSSIRVILTSFQEGREYQLSAEAVGADAFLSKSGFGEHVNMFIDSLFHSPKAA